MLDYQQLFTIALGLTAPWKIANIEFTPEDKRLDIHLDFEPGAKSALAFLPQFIDANNVYGPIPFLLLGLTFITTLLDILQFLLI